MPSTPSSALSALAGGPLSEIFDLFLDDSIPDDAEFQIPVDFDQIVEESFEKFSQEAERKMAGIVKKIINMEEEHAVRLSAT